MGLFSKPLEVWGHFWVWVFVVLKYNNKIYTYLFNTKKERGSLRYPYSYYLQKYQNRRFQYSYKTQ